MKKYFILTIAVTVIVTIIGYKLISSCKASDILDIIPTTILGIITSYIAYQQHLVAKEQKDIAEDKHRLELFGKRFETYKLFLDISLSASKISFYKRTEVNETDHDWVQSEEYRTKVKDEFDALISLGEQSRFLFGNDVFETLNKAREDIFHLDRLIDEIRRQKDQQPESKIFIQDVTSDMSPEIAPLLKNLSEINRNLTHFYSVELPKVMAPYLTIASYKNDDTL